MTEASPRAGTTLADAQRVHFVGIGGSGMAALATLLLQMGKQVSGSDIADGPALARLREVGASTAVGHRAENLDGAEYVVRSAAIPEDNPEVVEAEQRGLPNVKLAEAVGELMRDRPGVGVAGTHGKTTTTAIVTWLLDQGGLDPTALIGGEALNYSASAHLGEGPMVVEADEYDRRFLHLSPQVAVVTSVEADHLDYFYDLREITRAFQTFVDKLPTDGRLVVCADDPGAMKLSTHAERETYGFSASADWQAADYQPRAGGGTRFTLRHLGRDWPAEIPLVGEHNVRNALAAVAVADYFGVGLQVALAALPSFRGTRRRFETKGQPNGIRVVDDYAHHPTAVAATLDGARDVLPSGGQLWAVFQPHTTNRTAALLEEFGTAFWAADHVLLLPIYQPSGREAHARPVTSWDVAARARARGHPDVRLAETFDAAVDILVREARPNDVVLTMGAGDVTRLSDRLVQALEAGQ